MIPYLNVTQAFDQGGVLYSRDQGGGESAWLMEHITRTIKKSKSLTIVFGTTFSLFLYLIHACRLWYLSPGSGVICDRERVCTVRYGTISNKNGVWGGGWKTPAEQCRHDHSNYHTG